MASIASERTAVPSPVIITPQVPGWMSPPWLVMTTQTMGVTKNDTLRLRADGTIQQKGVHATAWKTWATSCQLSCAGLSGITVDHKPFLIKFDSANKYVTCTLQHPVGLTGQSLGPGPTESWMGNEGGGTIEPPPDDPDGSGNSKT